MNYNKLRKKKLKNCTFNNKGLIKAKRLLKKTNYKYKKNFKKEFNHIFIKKKLELNKIKTDLYDKNESYDYLVQNL